MSENESKASDKPKVPVQGILPGDKLHEDVVWATQQKNPATNMDD